MINVICIPQLRPEAVWRIWNYLEVFYNVRKGILKQHLFGGDSVMTVSKQLKTTLSSLKSAHASLESFALETESQTAKQMFSQFADQTKAIVEGIEARIQEIEAQEPQYRAR